MSDIKNYFISRYNEGYIVEADFSQLEVIYLAHLTRDKQLIEDIEHGLDMHTVRAAELFRKPERDVTKEERKTAKAFSFMLQYGAGATHMAERTGHTKELAQEFIHNYYKRYPDVRKWQEMNIDLVDHRAKRTMLKSPKGIPIRESKLQSETGRVYTFRQSDSPEWMARRGTPTSFKPTEIKNYPVQGGATGDIVPMMLGVVNRWIVSENLNDYICLIATVHDSIVADVHPEYLDKYCRNIKSILEDSPAYYEKNFGVPFTLPLNVGVEFGHDWGHATIEWKEGLTEGPA